MGFPPTKSSLVFTARNVVLLIIHTKMGWPMLYLFIYFLRTASLDFAIVYVIKKGMRGIPIKMVTFILQLGLFYGVEERVMG